MSDNTNKEKQYKPTAQKLSALGNSMLTEMKAKTGIAYASSISLV